MGRTVSTRAIASVILSISVNTRQRLATLWGDVSDISSSRGWGLSGAPSRELDTPGVSWLIPAVSRHASPLET